MVGNANGNGITHGCNALHTKTLAWDHPSFKKVFSQSNV